MDFALTPEQEELVARFAALHDGIAERAPRYDREIEFPREVWDDLRAAGLDVLAVPEEYGGLGVGLAGDEIVYCRILQEIAKADASTAQTFQIHTHLSALIGLIGTKEQKERLFHAVVDEGKLIGSWGSEPSAQLTGFALSDADEARRSTITTIAHPVDGGYQISGHKHFASLAGASDVGVIFALEEGVTNPIEGLILPIVPMPNPDVEVRYTWDTMGMRATVSHEVILKDVVVPEENILGLAKETRGAYFTSGAPDVFHLGFASNYVGTAWAAYEFALDFVKNERRDHHDTVVQEHFGEMWALLNAARHTVDEAAWLWNHRDEERYRARLTEACHRANYFAARTALDVVQRAFQVCGARSTSARYPLERYYRDIRTYTLAPPSMDKALETVGKQVLGVPLTASLIHAADAG